MADDPKDLEPLTEAELAEAEQASLYDDIAERWDPDRLLKLVAGQAGQGRRLDLATREKFERKLGTDLGHVKIYTGPFAEEITRAHGAEAITIGTTGMVLMSGTPDRSMATSEGQALLAHELTHVAQSQRGVYRRSTFEGSPDLAHEEAEEEAHAAEAEELAGDAGGGEQLAEQAEDAEKLREEITRRVLEMFADAEHLASMRGGDGRFRP